MSQCKNCLRGGSNVSLDSIGVCAHCSMLVFENIDLHRREIGHFIELVDDGQAVSSTLRACREATKQAMRLVEYEIKGIPTGDPAASEIINHCEGVKERVLEETLDTIVKNGLTLSEAAGTPEMKKRAIRFALLQLSLFYDENNISEQNSEHEKKLSEAILAINNSIT